MNLLLTNSLGDYFDCYFLPAFRRFSASAIPHQFLRLATAEKSCAAATNRQFSPNLTPERQPPTPRLDSSATTMRVYAETTWVDIIAMLVFLEG